MMNGSIPSFCDTKKCHLIGLSRQVGKLQRARKARREAALAEQEFAAKAAADALGALGE